MMAEEMAEEMVVSRADGMAVLLGDLRDDEMVVSMAWRWVVRRVE